MAEARFKYPDSDAARPQRRGGAASRGKRRAGGGRCVVSRAVGGRGAAETCPGGCEARPGASPDAAGRSCPHPAPGETWPVQERGAAPPW